MSDTGRLKFSCPTPRWSEVHQTLMFGREKPPCGRKDVIKKWAAPSSSTNEEGRKPSIPLSLPKIHASKERLNCHHYNMHDDCRSRAPEEPPQLPPALGAGAPKPPTVLPPHSPLSTMSCSSHDESRHMHYNIGSLPSLPGAILDLVGLTWDVLYTPQPPLHPKVMLRGHSIGGAPWWDHAMSIQHDHYIRTSGVHRECHVADFVGPTNCSRAYIISVVVRFWHATVAS
jgi:hypothetical protein